MKEEKRREVGMTKLRWVEDGGGEMGRRRPPPSLNTKPTLVGSKTQQKLIWVKSLGNS